MNTKSYSDTNSCPHIATFVEGMKNRPYKFFATLE